MSVVKLLSRIVAPKISEDGDGEEDLTKELHDHTYVYFSVFRVEVGSELSPNIFFSYGIASDPLTQFAVVLSALMHDVGKTHLVALPCVIAIVAFV
jgi:hypothetical protein